MTTKIAQFAKDHFGIELTDAQLQYIAIYSSGQRPILMGRRLSGITTANKVIQAYLQDGMKNAEVPPVVMSGKFDKIKRRDRMGGL